jgi:hypothetical protein
MESWTFATPGVPNETHDELLRRFDALSCLTPGGSLRPARAMPHFKRLYGLNSEVIRDKAGFTTAHLQQRLKKGLALLAYTSAPLGGGSGPAMSHVVVIYGADKFSFCAMDPLANPAAALPGAYWCTKATEFRADKTKLTLLWR